MINCPICNSELYFNRVNIKCVKEYNGWWNHFSYQLIDLKSSKLLNTYFDYSDNYIISVINTNYESKYRIVIRDRSIHSNIYEDNLELDLKEYNFYNTILSIIQPILLFY